MLHRIPFPKIGSDLWRPKKPIKKNHIKEFGGGSERPGDKFGTSQGHPGHLGRSMWKFTFKGQKVRGTDGTDDGTDGTCPRDRRDTNQGVSRQNSLCLLVFFFPHRMAQLKTLSFLVFLEKGTEKSPQKKRIFYPYRTPKIPGKEGKNARKNKEFLARKENKEFQKSKERKDREKPRPKNVSDPKR